MLGASGPHTNKVDTKNLCCSNSGVCRWRAGKLAPRQYATGAAATADRSPRPPRRRIALKVLGRGAEAPCRILRRPLKSRNATCSASAAGMVSCVHIMFGRVLRRKLPVTGHMVGSFARLMLFTPTFASATLATRLASGCGWSWRGWQQTQRPGWPGASWRFSRFGSR